MRGRNFFDRLIDALAVVAGALLVATVLIECFEVGMRYFFRRPQMWTVEVCEYLLFGITFLGAPWLLREGGHVTVDLVTERLSGGVRRVLERVSGLAGAVACGLLAWFGLVAALDCYRSGVVEVRTLDVPKFYFMLVLALGYGLLAAQFCRQLFARRTRGQEDG